MHYRKLICRYTPGPGGEQFNNAGIAQDELNGTVQDDNMGGPANPIGAGTSPYPQGISGCGVYDRSGIGTSMSNHIRERPSGE